jgi:hypothetical protein
VAEEDRPASTATTHVQSVRVRDQLRARIDALVVVLRERPPKLRVSRSNVLISIIEKGVEALEAELGHQPPTGPRDDGAPKLARTRARRAGSETRATKKSA